MKRAIKVGLISSLPIILLFIIQAILTRWFFNTFPVYRDQFNFINSIINILINILGPLIFFLILKDYLISYDRKIQGFRSLKGILLYGLGIDLVISIASGLASGVAEAYFAVGSPGLNQFLQVGIIIPILFISSFLMLVLFLKFLVDLLLGFTLLMVYLKWKRK